jgi:hypothetical protein
MNESKLLKSKGVTALASQEEIQGESTMKMGRA